MNDQKTGDPATSYACLGSDALDCYVRNQGTPEFNQGGLVYSHRVGHLGSVDKRVVRSVSAELMFCISHPRVGSRSRLQQRRSDRRAVALDRRVRRPVQVALLSAIDRCASVRVAGHQVAATNRPRASRFVAASCSAACGEAGPRGGIARSPDQLWMSSYGRAGDLLSGFVGPFATIVPACPSMDSRACSAPTVYTSASTASAAVPAGDSRRRRRCSGTAGGEMSVQPFGGEIETRQFTLHKRLLEVHQRESDDAL